MSKSRSGRCHRTAAACLRSNQSPRRLCQLLRRPADYLNRAQSASANQRPPITRSSRGQEDICSACSIPRRRPCPRTGASSRGGRGTSWPVRRACTETLPDTRRRGHNSNPTPQGRRACRGGVRGYEKTSLRSGEGQPAWWRIQTSSDLSCSACPSSSELLGRLAFSSLLYSPERAQPEPDERNREAHGKHQPSRSCRVARLVLPILAHAGQRSDSSKRQEGESSHFQPELMQHPPERARRRAETGQKRLARPAALHHVGGYVSGHTVNQLDFSRHFAGDRQSVGHSRSIRRSIISRF